MFRQGEGFDYIGNSCESIDENQEETSKMSNKEKKKQYRNLTKSQRVDLHKENRIKALKFQEQVKSKVFKILMDIKGW